MVKRGTRLIEGVNVSITEIERVSTPSPTVSDKDASDLCPKIRYLIDQAEAILAQTDAKLSTRASESTLSALNTKIPSDPAREGGNLATIAGRLNVNLDTRASESTLSSVDSKVGTQLSFNHGQVTVGTLAVQLPSAGAAKGVLVKAHKGNSGTVYIGNSNAVSTTTGFELAAGEAVVIEVNNANLIWVIADTADQKVSWVAV